MEIHLLSGFLGSGKTTAIQYASHFLMEQGIKTGVITNDQGIKLVDGSYFNTLKIPHRQVINGCLCCNYNDLESSIRSLIEKERAEVIFAESVGSCTDIVATVLKPLLTFHPGIRVTISVFADVRLLQLIFGAGKNLFDETVTYIYLKQLEEASIIVVNKIDLISQEELAEVTLLMQEKYNDKICIYQSSLDTDHIKYWLDTLDAPTPEMLPSLDINYDIYATGEARLAWLDQELEIFSSNQSALQTTGDLINNIFKKTREHNLPVGHLKFLINGETKISFITGSTEEVHLDAEAAGAASLLMNIRVQTAPEFINQLVTEAIIETELKSGSKILTHSVSAFQPGYPRPTHRL